MTANLTMALLAIENKVDFPKINYLTASDIYILVCLCFIISSTIGFAIVYYRTKLIDEQDMFIKYRFLMLKRRLKRNMRQIDKKTQSPKQLDLEPFSPRKLNIFGVKYVDETDLEFDSPADDGIKGLKINKPSQPTFEQSLSTQSHDSRDKINKKSNLANYDLVNFLNNFRKNLAKLKENINIKKKSLKRFERVSRIDILSRIYYPILFFIFNFIYWFYLLFFEED